MVAHGRTRRPVVPSQPHGPARKLFAGKSSSTVPARLNTTTLVLLLVVVSNVTILVILYGRVQGRGRGPLTINDVENVGFFGGGESSGVGLRGRQLLLGVGVGGGRRSGRGERGTKGSKRRQRLQRKKASEAEVLMLQQRERNFASLDPSQSFIQFSAYRRSASSFVAMGLAPLSERERKTVSRCWWEVGRHHGGGGSSVTVEGEPQLKYPGEHHNRPFEVVLLACDFQQAIQSNAGGALHMTIDNNDVIVLLESPGDSSHSSPIANSNSNSKDGRADTGGTGSHPLTDAGAAGSEALEFAYSLTHCSAPMYGEVSPQRFNEWLTYHQVVHGIDFFSLYDAGAVDEDVSPVVRRFVAAGQMEVTDVRATVKFETWQHAQILMANDCAMRLQHYTRWVLFMDIDEYLLVVQPPHSLLSLLSSVPDLPWITFGSYFFTLDHCNKVQDPGWQPWAVEQLVFREPVLHCKDKDPTRFYSRDACLKWDGHRKYAANPRAVQVFSIHRVIADPSPLHPPGLNAHSDVLHLNHYRGMAMEAVSLCKQIISLALPVPRGLVRDLRVARMAVVAQRLAATSEFLN